MIEIGRNESCWCGSGKKYKKCHLFSDQKKLELPHGTSLSELKEKNKNGLKSGNQKTNSWVKTPEEIEGMRKAGQFNGKLMDFIRPFVRPGISTQELDDLIRQYTYDHGHIPACLGYKGYPKSSCISPNEMVCHGIPSPDIVLKEGDIVNLDLTTIVDGFHGDQSETFLIGFVPENARRLTETAANAMIEGIFCVAPGISFSKIGEKIQNYVHERGYSIVVDFTGHGIGKKFHEEPPILHFKNTETEAYRMEPGMTFTVEPMINEGIWQVKVDKNDKWTVRTRDEKLSAQFEHTILVTDTGFEILTLTPSQKSSGVISHLATHPQNRLK